MLSRFSSAAYVLDKDGTLVNEGVAIPGAPEFLDRIRVAGTVCLAALAWTSTYRRISWRNHSKWWRSADIFFRLLASAGVGTGVSFVLLNSLPYPLTDP